MKRTALAAFMVMAAVFFVAGHADAFPTYGACTGCHNADSNVTLTAADQGCTGSNGSYRLTISTPHNWKKRYAVFNGAGTNIKNGTLPATVSLPEGQTYTIYGVTNKPGNPGTDTVTVTPSCAAPPPPPPPPTCTDVDGDGYFLEPGCTGATDCNDSDGSINPGAVEVCGDGIDNNCSGTVDEACADPATDTIVELIDENGFVIGSMTAGDCGKTVFYDVPAGPYFVEVTKGETHFARLGFVVPDGKSPARVIVKAETEDDDDEASLEVEVDVKNMKDSEKVTVKKLGGSTEWALSWANSSEDFMIHIVGNGVVNLDSVTLRTDYGTLTAYRIEVLDKRHEATAIFKKSDVIASLVPEGAEAGDRLRGQLSLVTPANDKTYRFRAKIID